MWHEKIKTGSPILVPVMIDGSFVYDFPELKNIQRYCASELGNLPDKYRKISPPFPVYPVQISPRLKQVRDRIYKSFREEYRR